jgi:GT2 family glycosyltransferase
MTSKLGFNLEVFDANYSFNFSRINNDVVKAFLSLEPSYLLFLNNDVEIISNSFLVEMTNLAIKVPKLGVLGCSLSYPDHRIQHLFLAPGVKILGAHPLKGVPLDSTHRWFQEPRPVAAVTGAVMLMQASVFKELNGFDELLPSLGQDLDLCLKAQLSGRVNWVASHLVCIHAEGLSRGKKLDKSQVKYMYDKWGPRLTSNDFFSRKLSRWSEYPVLSFGEADYPWEKVL